jgi:hypothetical protein
MIKYILLSLVTCAIVSCTTITETTVDYSHSLVDISKFNINDTILKDYDSVEILGSSGNLSDKDMDKMDFYSLVVVRSLRTGDTVNVLVSNYFMSHLDNPITQFMSNTSQIGMAVDNIMNKSFKGEGENIDLKEMKVRKFDKVFYDKEYIQVDVFHFPAITGNLGFYTYTKEE